MYCRHSCGLTFYFIATIKEEIGLKKLLLGTIHIYIYNHCTDDGLKSVKVYFIIQMTYF